MNSPFGFNDNTVDIGVKIGSEIGSKYLNNTSEWLSFKFLKPYFSINNRYLFRKVKQICLPFLYREPEITDEEDFNDNYFTIAKSRIEYPDLYLPLVSFMTYILLITFYFAFSKGEEFDPDFLGSKCTKNFILVIVHVALLKTRKNSFIKINFSIICFL